jgi:hypothetical protein
LSTSTARQIYPKCLPWDAIRDAARTDPETFADLLGELLDEVDEVADLLTAGTLLRIGALVESLPDWMSAAE